VRGRLGGRYDGRVRCQRSSDTTGSRITPSHRSVTGGGNSSSTAATAAAIRSNSSSSSASLAGITLIDDMVFPVKIAQCSPGHEPLVVFVSEGRYVAKECVACKDRTFNFDGVACRTCPLGGECLGGDRLEARSGWWRSSNTSTVLFACPFAAACMAGNTTAAAACALGYHGPVCGGEFAFTLAATLQRMVVCLSLSPLISFQEKSQKWGFCVNFFLSYMIY